MFRFQLGELKITITFKNIIFFHSLDEHFEK